MSGLEHEEILRLRDRMHKVESRLIGLELAAKGLLGWKERIEPIIEDLREADRIAEEVANRLSEQHRQALTEGSYRVTKWQMRVGIGSLGIAGVALGLTALQQAGVI